MAHSHSSRPGEIARIVASAAQFEQHLALVRVHATGRGVVPLKQVQYIGAASRTRATTHRRVASRIARLSSAASVRPAKRPGGPIGRFLRIGIE